MKEMSRPAEMTAGDKSRCVESGRAVPELAPSLQ